MSEKERWEWELNRLRMEEKREKLRMCKQNQSIAYQHLNIYTDTESLVEVNELVYYKGLSFILFVTCISRLISVITI